MKLNRRIALAVAALAVGVGMNTGVVVDRPVHAAPAASTTSASLGLTSAPNARDAAGPGYRTQGNRRIKTGVVYRSDKLSALTTDEQAILANAGIASVIDFRMASESATAVDKLPATAALTSLPVDDAGLTTTLTSAMYGGTAKQIELLGGGKAAALMENLYRTFITDATKRATFASALRAVADSTAPVLYHCTSGKDRTGFMSATLLSIAGVPRGAVTADFLQSNANLKANNQAFITQMTSAGVLTAETAELFWPVLGVQKSYLDAAFTEIAKSYGSFDTFVKNGLGLTDSEVTKLRDRVIVK